MPLQSQQGKGERGTEKSLLAVFATCLIIFITICWYTVLSHHDAFDKSVISYLTQHRSSGLIEAMRWITFGGSSLFLFPANCLLVACLGIKKYYREAIAIAITSSGGWVIQTTLKLLFRRYRPEHPLILNISTFSFPSGHAFSSLVFFGMVAFLVHRCELPGGIKKLLVAFTLLCPIAIGCSRVVLNVHYATDVIAGWALAVMWLIGCYYFLFKRDKIGSRADLA